MNIQRIEIKGFKSVANLTLHNVNPLLVFAGPNGAGKSNITDSLAFFGSVINNGAIQALREFGGFKHIHCFKFKKDQRTTISFSIAIEINGDFYDYTLRIKSIDKVPEVIESLKVNQKVVIDRKSSSETKMSWRGHDELQSFPDYPKHMTALYFLGFSPLRDFLSNIQVFRFDPFAAKEPNGSTLDASALEPHGKNLATILSMMESDVDFRSQVLEWIELIVPGMENVSTEKQRLDSSTVITFKEMGTRTYFPAKLISDGTIYSLCILTAILSRAKMTGITIIEEPERGIHPKAIGELVDLMRKNASNKHPIFLTTHSESVIRNLKVEELFLINKSDGKTTAKAASKSGVDKKMIPLDTAWLTNLFDGGLPW